MMSMWKKKLSLTPDVRFFIFYIIFIVYYCVSYASTCAVFTGWPSSTIQDTIKQLLFECTSWLFRTRTYYIYVYCEKRRHHHLVPDVVCQTATFFIYWFTVSFLLPNKSNNNNNTRVFISQQLKDIFYHKNISIWPFDHLH